MNEWGGVTLGSGVSIDAAPDRDGILFTAEHRNPQREILQIRFSRAVGQGLRDEIAQAMAAPRRVPVPSAGLELNIAGNFYPDQLAEDSMVHIAGAQFTIAPSNDAFHLFDGRLLIALFDPSVPGLGVMMHIDDFRTAAFLRRLDAAIAEGAP